MTVQHYEVQFGSPSGPELAGLLGMPRLVTKCPGVVLVGGSGPSDRHNDGYFTQIRQHLERAGMAVLSYDKRGVGASDGDWRTATIDELAGDVAAATRYLQKRVDVAQDGVVVFGHSEGGWVALRSCVEFDQPTALILSSSPAVSFP